METIVFIHIFCIVYLVDAIAVQRNTKDSNITINEFRNEPDNVFNGVYTECFFRLSYTCLQKKTLLYIKELNNLSEVSVVGDFVKFVKINTAGKLEDNIKSDENSTNNSEELELMIDKAVNGFFSNHVLKFSALGNDIPMSNNVEEFVGRKKRKGGGGGGDHGDHDGGKKKMMMMAMMCMKMKLMIMIPAMMGMMGMMSFKGMMFSMMSFMVSKMMLLMKILEKKGVGGAFGGGSGAGSDAAWAASGGGGGAWMPAGGQDYAGGGYDANAQWQSRSIYEIEHRNKPIISYVTPIVSYSHVDNKKSILSPIRTLNEVIRNKITDIPKSRKKRDLMDIIHNTYTYWINKLFGVSNKRRSNVNVIPKYKTVNGVKYVYYPFRTLQRVKMIKDVQGSRIKTVDEGFKPIIAADDFNKGEIFEGAVESRMNRKKFHKMKDAVNDTLDDNPWE